jgi:UDP-N-acetylmuramoylalanine--D-glutamate ligase
MNRNLLKGYRVGVLGLGRSGIAAANLAVKLGAEVLASDNRTLKELKGFPKKLNRSARLETGGHSPALLESDLVIKSPGVPPRLPILGKIKKKKIPVWSELELALRASKPGYLAAITGTNGKTTTTTLVGEVFMKARGETFVAGNIGSPLADCAPSVGKGSRVVLEVSSYQLEDSPTMHPQVSAILNITPDHLEHHGTMAAYASAKARIFENQTKKDICVLNHDDAYCRKLAAKCPARVVYFSRLKALKKGVWYEHGTIYGRIGSKSFAISPKLRIPGNHNVENALAAAAVCAAAGIKPPVIEKALSAFKGVEHRIEFTAEINGVRYINDSKGTNVDSTRVALDSFPGPVWLILGGRDKGSPYAPLKPLVREKVKGLLLIGEAAGRIDKELRGTAPVFRCGTIKAALAKARSSASEGDTVLLSPACASFDQFEDYEHRGRYFKECVAQMKRDAKKTR